MHYYLKARLKKDLTDSILFESNFGYSKPIFEGKIFFHKGKLYLYRKREPFSQFFIKGENYETVIGESLFKKYFITLEDERDNKIKNILE